MKQIVAPNTVTLTSGTAGCVHKFFKVARTDTTAVDAIGLPASLIPVHVSLHSLGAVSDAATTATVQLIDKSSTSVLATMDAKTAKVDLKAVDVQPLLALDTRDTWLQLKYAETGTASTTGGPWLVVVECMAVG